MGCKVKVELPGCYAAHRLRDGRWEILATDDDPFRPPHRVTLAKSISN